MSEQQPEAQPQVTRRPPRRGGTVGDLLRTVVLVALAAGVVLVLLPRPQGPTARVPDLAAEVATVRLSSPYPVLAPSPLPSGWAAVRADADTRAGGAAVWRLSVATPDNRVITLEQSRNGTGTLAQQERGHASDKGQVTVDGQQWQRLERLGAGPPRRTLTRPVGDSVAVVTGDATWQQLETFVSSLEAPRA
ncbi:MAG: DUF4245 domain-containing protein [Actinomycetales bacterium]